MQQWRYYIPWFLVIIGLLFGAYLWTSTQVIATKKNIYTNIASVRVIPAVVASYAIPMMINGKVKPYARLKLRSQVSGQIEAINNKIIKRGLVNKDEILIKIDNKDYLIALQKTKAQLDQAYINWSYAKADQQIADSEILLAKSLSKKMLEPTPLSLKKPQLNYASSSLKLAQAVYQQAQINLARCNIKSPFTGIIVDGDISIGQLVTPNTSLITIHQKYPAIVVAQFPVILNKWLPTTALQNMKATIIAKHNKNLFWPAKVIGVNRSLKEDRLHFALILELVPPNDLSSVPSGMHVDVKITGRTIHNISALPHHVINNNNTVLRIKNNNTLELVPVDIVYNFGKKVHVRGLNHKDLIVVSSTRRLLPGMKVKIFKE